MNNQYLFCSARLGFRNWQSKDLEPMADLNNNTTVMAYYPALQNLQQTKEFLNRMQIQLREKGYCYFAVELLESSAFIGYIGLSWQSYEADFTPCIDIGWRLHPSVWNQGLATEGAIRCLQYAKAGFHFEKIYSVTPSINKTSEKVMQKTGMQKVKEFSHPLLQNHPHLSTCVLYSIAREEISE